jgi:acylphosphatase
MHRVHLVIQGRVQGVGFRYFVLRRAQALDLTGWVRNRSDGGVEVEAEGSRHALELLIEQVREGPANARVSHLTSTWSEGSPQHPRFLVGPDSSEP